MPFIFSLFHYPKCIFVKIFPFFLRFLAELANVRLLARMNELMFFEQKFVRESFSAIDQWAKEWFFLATCGKITMFFFSIQFSFQPSSSISAPPRLFVDDVPPSSENAVGLFVWPMMVVRSDWASALA
jgi:hypothetical protein